MELTDFFRVIIRWKWLVVTILFLVGGYSLFSAVKSQEKFRAETTVVTGLSHMSQLSQGTGGINVAQHGDNIAATYAEVVTWQPVLNKALQRAELDWPAETLETKVKTSISKDTPVLQISVEDTDAERAMALANALGESLVEYIKETSQATLDSSKFRLSQELITIEQEISVEQEAIEPNLSKIKVLQDKRDLALKEFNNMLQLELDSVDVNLVNRAVASKPVDTKANQKALVIFIVGLATSVVAAFATEAVSKAFKASNGEGAR